MTSVGEKLRSERLRRGLTLMEVAERTRIQQRFIEAIESDDPSSLPAGFFYRSFVRQYAQALGLDENQFEVEIGSARPAADATLSLAGEPERRYISPVPSSSRDGTFGETLNKTSTSIVILIVVVLGCSGLYALWYKTWRQPQDQPVPAVAPVPLPQPPSADRQVAAPPPPASTPEQGSPAPAQPPVKSVPGADVVLEMTAVDRVWISVTSGGKRLLVTTLEPGDSRKIEATGSVRLVAGNAGGLEVRLNGKPIGTLGPRGQPSVAVFSPEGYQIAPRKPAAPE
jgi:cytoskeletal protein RodZ